VNHRTGVRVRDRVPNRCRLLIRAAVAGLLTGALSAQAQFDEPYTVRQQQADGRWSAALGGGDPGADVPLTSLLLLAHLGDGSSLTTGPQREVVQRAVQWLRSQQDAKGRIGLRAEPGWLLDHAIATWALAEALRLSAAPMLAADVRRAAAALGEQIDRVRPAPGVELRLWCTMVAQSLRAGGQALRTLQAAGDAEALDFGAEALDRCRASWSPALPVNEREQAAQLLLDELLDAAAPADALPACWPADPLLDPLATWYVTTALWRRGGAGWMLATKQIELGVLKQERHDVDRGSWDPEGAFGVRFGRLGTTAMAVLLLEVYYRHCRLWVCDG
jgi:hypothetical protein